MAILKKNSLTLETSANDRGCNDVWVENSTGETSSYACAIGEGYLGYYKLSQTQIDWLNSQAVQDWLDINNY